ncbi:MAG TPA: hypothetical protein VGR43_00790, partial [Dehalococcoidia bacterium]|nr:hypothetical protein [Dehalococcoidia bacterium]
ERERLRAVFQLSKMNSRDVSVVMDCLAAAGARNYCADVAESHKTQALMLLDSVPLNEDRRRELRATAAFLLERDY